MPRFNEYNLPRLPGVIGMTKVKNALHKADPNLIMKISNVRVNGQLRGCSGFVTNPATNATVYLNTEITVGIHGILFRRAAHDRDFRGERNQFCDAGELVECVLTELSR